MKINWGIVLAVAGFAVSSVTTIGTVLASWTDTQKQISVLQADVSGVKVDQAETNTKVNRIYDAFFDRGFNTR